MAVHVGILRIGQEQGSHGDLDGGRGPAQGYVIEHVLAVAHALA